MRLNPCFVKRIPHTAGLPLFVNGYENGVSH